MLPKKCFINKCMYVCLQNIKKTSYFATGPLLKKMIELMASKIAGEIPQQKVQIYSAVSILCYFNCIYLYPKSFAFYENHTCFLSKLIVCFPDMPSLLIFACFLILLIFHFFKYSIILLSNVL